MIKYNINIFQIQVRYIKDPMLKNRTHREQVINMFQSEFQEKTLKAIKDLLMKKCVFVLSFIMFYDNRTTVLYKK